MPARNSFSQGRASRGGSFRGMGFFNRGQSIASLLLFLTGDRAIGCLEGIGGLGPVICKTAALRHGPLKPKRVCRLSGCKPTGRMPVSVSPSRIGLQFEPAMATRLNAGLAVPLVGRALVAKTKRQASVEPASGLHRCGRVNACGCLFEVVGFGLEVSRIANLGCCVPDLFGEVAILGDELL